MEGVQEYKNLLPSFSLFTWFWVCAAGASGGGQRWACHGYLSTNLLRETRQYVCSRHELVGEGGVGVGLMRREKDELIISVTPE